MTLEKLVCKHTFLLKLEYFHSEWRGKHLKIPLSDRGSMSAFERKVILEIASLENVEWWHRSLEKQEFFITGFN
jgi:hypothetical protein